jgi:hypothetical protein
MTSALKMVSILIFNFNASQISQKFEGVLRLDRKKAHNIHLRRSGVVIDYKSISMKCKKMSVARPVLFLHDAKIPSYLLLVPRISSHHPLLLRPTQVQEIERRTHSYLSPSLIINPALHSMALLRKFERKSIWRRRRGTQSFMGGRWILREAAANQKDTTSTLPLACPYLPLESLI